MTVLSLTAKCSDLFSATLMRDGQDAGEYNGYVPGWMPGNHCGDYIILHIEAATGRILNWTPPTEEQIADTFREQFGEESSCI